MSRKKREKVNIVYSTNKDYEYEYDDESVETLPPDEQELKVFHDRKMRKGKSVTIVSGFEGDDDDLKDLGKYLKSKCGVGGSVKEGEIIIQGELRDKIAQLLIDKGYTQTKKAGG